MLIFRRMLIEVKASVDTLVSYLVKYAKSDAEKVHAFSMWILLIIRLVFKKIVFAFLKFITVKVYICALENLH